MCEEVHYILLHQKKTTENKRVFTAYSYLFSSIGVCTEKHIGYPPKYLDTSVCHLSICHLFIYLSELETLSLCCLYFSMLVEF